MEVVDSDHGEKACDGVSGIESIDNNTDCKANGSNESNVCEPVASLYSNDLQYFSYDNEILTIFRKTLEWK